MRGGRNYSCGTAHSFSHLLITPKSLYPETNCLQLRSHLIELLYISPSSDQVLGHNFARILYKW